MNCGLLVSLVAAVAAPPAAQEGKAPPPGNVRTATAKEGESITVKVRIADAKQNIVTVVTFPGHIANVIQAWDREDLSVVNDQDKLFLKLLANVQGYVDVITTKGLHFRLLVIPVPAPGPYDSNVRVRMKDTTLKQVGPGPQRNVVGVLELAKAMRLGEVPPDATVRSGKDEVLWSGSSAEMRLLYVYETGRFRGYVLKFANLSGEEAYHVDVTKFTGKKMVLIGSKDVVVPPKRSTRIYIVDWK